MPQCINHPEDKADYQSTRDPDTFWCCHCATHEVKESGADSVSRLPGFMKFRGSVDYRRVRKVLNQYEGQVLSRGISQQIIEDMWGV
jgi:hypothetical protein